MCDFILYMMNSQCEYMGVVGFLYIILAKIKYQFDEKKNN